MKLSVFDLRNSQIRRVSQQCVKMHGLYAITLVVSVAVQRYVTVKKMPYITHG